MAFFLDIANFGIKVVILAVVIAILVSLVLSLFRQEHVSGEIVVTSLDEHYDRMQNTMFAALPAKERKAAEQQAKAAEKSREEQEKNVYILDFHGDLAATMVTDLREQVTAVLMIARPNDEVVLVLESDGGMYENYGLAAAQLDRLRDEGIQLTVCVDRVAASGGYMMACMADQLLAAPFAIVGSIGVAVTVPNAHRLLQRFDVDFLELTAGEYKRTVGYFGEVTDKGKQKVLDDLEDSHNLFKEHIRIYRPKLDVDRFATGESWYGRRAVDLGLIDAVATSDAYLAEQRKDARLFRVSYHAPRSVRDRVVSAVTESADHLLIRWWRRLTRARAERT